MSVQIHIDDPCSQNWDRMSPEAQGRFCGSCQKMVVDFTSFTDEEVLHWFTSHSGSTCGRFREEQLQRPTVTMPVRKVSRWRYWHYLIAGLLFTSKASAQTAPANVPVVQQPVSGLHVIGDTIAYIPSIIRGRVTDSSGHGIPSATIMISRKRGILTDDNGYFSIDVSTVSREQMLTVSSVGYQTIQISINQLLTTGTVAMHPVIMPDRLIMGRISAQTVHRKKQS